MDFRRIESIFLIVFLALDIFLFVSYTQKGSNVTYDSTPSVTNEQAIIKDMKEDHITVGKLATAKGEGYYLASASEDVLAKNAKQLNSQSTSYNYNTHKLTSTFNVPLGFGKNNVVTVLKGYIENNRNVLYGSEYVYQAGLSDPKNTVVFTQKTRQGVIIDPQGTLVFKISNGTVTGYTQTYLPNMTVLREKQNTISAQDAIELLYTSSEIAQNSKIVWYKLGYSELTEVRGSIIFVPVWNVMIQHKGTKNETLKKVNALTKTIIKGTATDNTTSNSSSNASQTSSSNSSSSTTTNTTPSASSSSAVTNDTTVIDDSDTSESTGDGAAVDDGVDSNPAALNSSQSSTTTSATSSSSRASSSAAAGDEDAQTVVASNAVAASK